MSDHVANSVERDSKLFKQLLNDIVGVPGMMKGDDGLAILLFVTEGQET